MPGKHLPADHSRGDVNTLGGYVAVHDRPAAFEGADGFSYSVELMADRLADPARPWGAYLLFVRWKRIGEPGVEGHLETEHLAFGDSEDAALTAIGRLSLAEVRALLDALVATHLEARPQRRWWDVMRDDDGESA